MAENDRSLRNFMSDAKGAVLHHIAETFPAGTADHPGQQKPATAGPPFQQQIYQQVHGGTYPGYHHSGGLNQQLLSQQLPNQQIFQNQAHPVSVLGNQHQPRPAGTPPATWAPSGSPALQAPNALSNPVAPNILMSGLTQPYVAQNLVSNQSNPAQFPSNTGPISGETDKPVDVIHAPGASQNAQIAQGPNIEPAKMDVLGIEPKNPAMKPKSAPESASRTYHRMVIEYEKAKLSYLNGLKETQAISQLAYQLETTSFQIWCLRRNHATDFSNFSSSEHTAIVLYWRTEYELWADIVLDLKESISAAVGKPEARHTQEIQQPIANQPNGQSQNSAVRSNPQRQSQPGINARPQASQNTTLSSHAQYANPSQDPHNGSSGAPIPPPGATPSLRPKSPGNPGNSPTINNAVPTAAPPQDLGYAPGNIPQKVNSNRPSMQNLLYRQNP